MEKMLPSEKEKVKEYWNKRPCNIKHSSKPFLSKEYFDEVEKKKYFVEDHIPSFADFPRWSGKKVLEIGCGIGTDSINFARHGAILTIVEFSEVSLDICKRRFSLYNLKATFYLGDAENLSSFLPMEEYDLVYSFGVLHHTPNQEKIFSEVSRYVSSTTELRIMLYSKVSFKFFSLMLKDGLKDMSILEDLIRKNSEAEYDCPVTYTYTLKEADDILSRNGLEVMKIWKDHIFPWSIEEYKKNVYVKDEFWIKASDSESLLRSLAPELGWHTLIIAKRR